MFKKAFLALAVAASSIASTASADNFNIIFVDGGFFPEITYLFPGDTVTFINETEDTITAEATDESWSTGPLGLNQSYLLPIASDTVLTYGDPNNISKTGLLSFDLAPLADFSPEGSEGAEETTDTSTD
ncbi:hypothetical protein [Planktotalea sp.]|uniref:hypothetical protein n=1 Tax=Planktotalea sp. TaxID=2029877 RepID=UPI0032978399